jgi:hypothetical protein
MNLETTVWFCKLMHQFVDTPLQRPTIDTGGDLSLPTMVKVNTFIAATQNMINEGAPHLNTHNSPPSKTSSLHYTIVNISPPEVNDNGNNINHHSFCSPTFEKSTTNCYSVHFFIRFNGFDSFRKIISPPQSPGSYK